MIRVKDEYSRKDGRIDMCQALKELLADERMEGRASGLAEGRLIGHASAIKEVVMKMVQKGKSDEEVMELTDCSAQMLWEVKEGLKK